MKGGHKRPFFLFLHELYNGKNPFGNNLSMQKNLKTGVLLLQLGTPRSPSVWDVGRYLRQFLNDYRVIDIPAIARFLLVNGIIIPFRVRRSAAAYKKLWMPKGSPLLNHGLKLQNALQISLGENYGVHLAMRYQEPSIPKILKEMEKRAYHKVIIVPLFPQYASSTTGSALEKALQGISRWYVIPSMHVISQYMERQDFIKAWIEIGKSYSPETYDYVLFSFHGLPIRQLDKVYQDGKPCKDHFCKERWQADNYYCYEASCYETARRIAEGLGINKERYQVVFQSRLGKEPWLEPYAEPTIISLAKQGIKNLLVFSPAFVSDCLETTIEIGEEYMEEFIKHGGKHLQLVESLNVHPLWVDCLKNLILEIY